MDNHNISTVYTLCHVTAQLVISYCCAERCNICWNLPVIDNDTSKNLSTQFDRHVSVFASKRSFSRSPTHKSQHISVSRCTWQHNSKIRNSL